MKNKIIATLLACSLMVTALCACSAGESKSSKKHKDDDSKVEDKDKDDDDDDEEEEEKVTTAETTKQRETAATTAPETTAATAPEVVFPEPVEYYGDSYIEYLDLVANECYGADVDTARSYLEEELGVSLTYGTEPNFSTATAFSVDYYYVEYSVDLYVGDMYFNTLSICYFNDANSTVYDIGFTRTDITEDEAYDFYNDVFNECSDLWEIDTNDSFDYWSQTTFYDDLSNQVYIMGGSWGEPSSDTSYTYLLVFEDHSTPYYIG